MRTTEYLYGVNLSMLEEMKYFQALQYKLNSGRRLYKQLYDRIWLKGEDNEALQERIYFVQKAIIHTEKLLKEREEM